MRLKLSTLSITHLTYILHICYQYLTYILLISYPILTIVHPYLTNCSPISYPNFNDIVSISYPHFIRISPISYQLLIDNLPILIFNKNIFPKPILSWERERETKYGERDSEREIVILHLSFYEMLVSSYSEHDFRIVFGYDYITFTNFSWGGVSYPFLPWNVLFLSSMSLLYLSWALIAVLTAALALAE